MLIRGETTEERIAKIAQGFGQGLQNFQQGQDRQRVQGLQEEAARRQQALQEMEIEGKLSEQTGKNLLGSGIGKQYLTGGMAGIGDLMKSAPMTRKAEMDAEDRIAKAEDRDINNQYRQSQINKNNRGPAPKKGQMAGGTQLKPNEVDKFNEGNQIPSMLSDVSKVIDQNADSFGPIRGRLGALNPYNEKAQTIESSMRTSAQAFGKYMEGGMLRAEDEIKYRKMFPSQEDTPEVARNKLDLVNRLLVEKQNSTVGALKQAGYDTSPIERQLTKTAQPQVLGGGMSKDVLKTMTREEKMLEVKKRLAAQNG